MFRQGRRNENYGVYLLLMQLLSNGLGDIPPVTLSTIILNAVIYLGILDLPSKSKVCISSHELFRRHDWMRTFTAPIFHADDMHLYYNMISFLWKGRTLETMFGSAYFAYLLVVFSFLTTLSYAVLSHLITVVTGDPSYAYSCALGFSGVIFALKVLTTEYTSPGSMYVMGLLPVPSKYAMWAELLLIQFFVPGTSFLGHLAGILVGLAYTQGPLRSVMNAGWSLF